MTQKTKAFKRLLLSMRAKSKDKKFNRAVNRMIRNWVESLTEEEIRVMKSKADAAFRNWIINGDTYETPTRGTPDSPKGIE